jgi:hypothetical protein
MQQAQPLLSVEKSSAARLSHKFSAGSGSAHRYHGCVFVPLIHVGRNDMPLLIWLLLALCICATSAELALLASSGEWSDTVRSGAPALTLFRRPRGRPRKFAAPSRSVTLILPESVIATLSALHHDLSQAIVGLTRRPARVRRAKPAELLVFGDRAVITVRPTPSLEAIPGVQLVPLPDGRALLTFKDPTSLSALQLHLHDALEDKAMSTSDLAVHQELSELLREARRSPKIALEPCQLIVLESAQRVRTNGKTADRSGSKR